MQVVTGSGLAHSNFLFVRPERSASSDQATSSKLCVNTLARSFSMYVLLASATLKFCIFSSFCYIRHLSCVDHENKYL